MNKKGNSAMAIGHNEDLITEILLRLPARSILRFKAVSKQWLSIVSSPRFRQIHATSGAATATTGLLFNAGTSLEFLSPDQHSYNPMRNSDQPIKILSSSGGLLLLLRSKSRDYCICNPATNEIKSLTAVPQVIKESKYVAACLAFDLSISLNYKVLFVCGPKNYKDYNRNRFQSMIYSSETRTFRSLETIFTALPSKGIYWNNAIHWIGSDPMRSLSYFDLSKECVNVHRLSRGESFSDLNLYIGQHRGNFLTVTCGVCIPSQFSQFRVYELSKRNYSAWSLKYQIDLGIHYPALSIPIDKFIGIYVDEEQDLSIVIRLADNMLVACNLKKKLYNILGNCAQKGNYNSVYQYKETLACV